MTSFNSAASNSAASSPPAELNSVVSRDTFESRESIECALSDPGVRLVKEHQAAIQFHPEGNGWFQVRSLHKKLSAASKTCSNMVRKRSFSTTNAVDKYAFDDLRSPGAAASLKSI